ncbi:MAG: hypothetical protein ABS43_18460 [Bordetella sp. SCN 67-23]|nr:tripartite tricarboxylate transporter substrate binding protein [Burkholderiales bacterium]ODS72173.1 MAG: hypothetical protein ABS43_18460 [Bordetella sp. SCN 67-23]ODU67843.1 MAG: hypothetical protein ABT00_20135 [Bordetella sp. SCN 68-11]OJW92112.1 MAG: hypothetical protein BGO71_06240 [Burkholderiales bacterium 67-32]
MRPTPHHLLRLATLSLLLAAPTVHAQPPAYPTKPIKVVVPFLPGGTADTLMRLISAKASPMLGQQVVVENRAGAGGNIGADEVARAAADGYTLLFTPPGPLAINPYVFPNMPYDARTAFRPISIVGTMPSVLVVGPRVEARNVQDLIRHARSHPGSMTYASQGYGTTTQLLGGLFAIKAGAELVHVPYKGAPPILADLRAGRVDLVFFDSANALPQLGQNASLRALAVTSEQRSAALPDVPTLREAGFPDMVTTVWMGLAAPAGTPDAIVQAWLDVLDKIMRMPELRKRFEDQGVEPLASGPDDMRRTIERDARLWSDVIRVTGASNR